MVVNVTKISQMMKKSFFDYRKNITEWEKMPFYNYKKLFLKKINDLESSFHKEYKDVLKL